MNWQDPFKLAFELGMSIIGWGLVLLIGAIGIILAFAIGKAFVAAFTKKPKKKKSPVDQAYDKAINEFKKAKNFRVVKDEE